MGDRLWGGPTHAAPWIARQRMGAIKDFLPGREDHLGGTAVDNWLSVDAVLSRYRTGIPWRDLPARFGDWKIVHQRFGRWGKSGVFERIFKLLASDPDNKYMMPRKQQQRWCDWRGHLYRSLISGLIASKSMI